MTGLSQIFIKFPKAKVLLLGCIVALCCISMTGIGPAFVSGDTIASYQVDPAKQTLKMYWKDDRQINIGSLANLKEYIRKKGGTLLFATNGGMYKKDGAPQGLYIERGTTLAPLDAYNGDGNFYLKPNGLFYLTDDRRAFVCRTEDFEATKRIAYATQSGPMLVVDGKIHPAFNPKSTNLNIRNGVGVLPNGEVLFAISTTEINFYQLAKFFQQAGCQNALYLDGFVSRMYCPTQKLLQQDGQFGVIIGVTD